MINAESHPVPMTGASAHPARATVAAHTAVTSAAPSLRPKLFDGKHTCVDGGGVNCTTPRANTLYVVLPTHREVGLNTDAAPIDCSSLPTTPVTHCEPSHRKS